MIIAKYKFDTSIYENLVPDFNSEFTSDLYSITDETDSTNSNIKIRTINSESLPTLMRFGQVWVEGETSATNKSKSLLEILDMSTSNLNSMNSMFRFCNNLASISCNWDTSNVTSMYAAFSGCSKLTSLDVSNFNTSKVTNMSYIFNYCSSLTSLDVSNWSTDKVNSMYSMFYYCSSLTSLDANNWNTDKVADMAYMFKGCSSLVSLDVSNWNTSNITNMIDMFKGCSSLTSLDVSNWNTSNITNMAGIFYDCSSLTSLDVSNWNTSNVTDINSIFFNCSSLTSLDVSNWNTSKVTNTYAVFASCRSLTSLDLSNWDTSNVTSMSFMFSECSLLTSLDVSNWNTSNVTTMKNIFNNCNRLSNIGAIYCSTTTINALSSALGTTIPRTVWVGDNINISTLTSYTNVTYKQQITSKAKVLLDEPLRKGDTIEVVDGKVKHVHKMGQVTLDENTLWNDIGNNIYTTQVDNMPTLHLNEFLCDNLKPLDRYQTLDENLNSYGVASIQDALRVRIPLVNSSTELRSYLHSNPLDAVYKLASTYSTPAQLMSNSGLTLSTSTNNYLHANTVIPTKVRLSAFEEKVNILANTRYYVRFTADKASTVNVSLGGSTTESVTTKVGCNEVIITTPGTLTNSKLVIDCNGDNVNISKAMVVKNESGLDRASYFKDIESAYESRKCEQLISSQIEEFTLVSPDSGYTSSDIVINRPIKTNTTYTLIVDAVLNGSSELQFNSVVLGGNAANPWGSRISSGNVKRKIGSKWVYSFTTESHYYNSNYGENSIKLIVENTSYSGNIDSPINTTFKDIRLYEGDFVYDYPQEWHTGVKYLVNAKITGKNKFDVSRNVESYNRITNVTLTNGKFAFDYNGTYPSIVWDLTDLLQEFKGRYMKCSAVFTNTNSDANNVIYLQGTDFDGNFIYYNTIKGLKIDNSLRKLQLKIITNNTSTSLSGSATVENIQIEEVASTTSEATAYEPHHEETKQLLLNSPLYKGDSIEYINGCINHVHRMKEVVLNGNEDEFWFLYNDQTSPGFKTFGKAFGDFTKNVMFPEASSNRFSYIKGGYNKPSESISSFGDATNSSAIYVSINTDRLSEISETGFKQWLSKHPLRVIYQLDKPYLEPLGPTELQYTANANYTLSAPTNVQPLKLSLRGLTDRNIAIKPNTRYMVRFYADKAGSLTVRLGGVMANVEAVKGINTTFITTPSSIDNTDLEITGSGVKVRKVSVIEDVNAIGGYYKGMANSFDDCYISDSSDPNYGKYKVEVKMTGKNLCPVNEFTCTATTNVGGPSTLFTLNKVIIANIQVDPNKIYRVTSTCTNSKLNIVVLLSNEPLNKLNTHNDAYINTSDLGGKELKELSLKSFTGCKYITITTGGSNGHIAENEEVTFSNIQLEEIPTMNSPATTFEPYTEQVKTVYLNEPLLEGDRIEYHNGKLCHLHNSKKIILSGADSEPWAYDVGYNGNGPDTMELSCRLNTLTDDNKPNGSLAICNKFPDISDIVTERIILTEDFIFVVINKTRLTEVSVGAFKAWLRDNPLEIVYDIQKPYYEELSDDKLLFKANVISSVNVSDSLVHPKTVYFKGFEEELPTLVGGKEYQVKFKSDKTATISIDLGGTIQTESIVGGWNKIVITTPSTLAHNKVIISAQGNVKIEKVIVTDNTAKVSYFKGLMNAYESELVTDVNDANYGKYKVDVKLVGKNLSKVNTLVNIIGDRCSTNSPIYFIEGVIYTISLNYTLDVSTEVWLVTNNGYPYPAGIDASTVIQKITDGFIINNTFTFTAKATGSFYVQFRGARDQLMNVTQYQVEVGNTATPYEPYYESTATVYLNSPLLKEDTIEYIDGKLYHVHRYNKIELDGSEDEGLYVVNNSVSSPVGVIIIPDIQANGPNENDVTVLSNTLPGISRKTLYESKMQGISNAYLDATDSTRNGIFIQVSNISTVDEFNQWLQANHTTVAYKLAKPIYEELQTGGLFVKASTSMTKPTVSTTSVIPVKSMAFVNHQEELVLAQDTTYSIQFNAKTTRNESLNIDLGGTPKTVTVTNGLNRFEVTTPATLSHSKLIMSGQGFTISNVMVTKKIADINLDYFKGLSSTGEYDETTGKYVVETVMHGKNLWDVNRVNADSSTTFTKSGNDITVTGSWYVSWIIPEWMKGKKITLSYQHSGSLNLVCVYDMKNGWWQKQLANITNTGNSTFVVPKDNKTYGILFYSGSGTEGTSTYSNIQLEYGDTATAYEAPDISTTKVYLNSPLLEGDELVVRGKKIVHVHNSKKLVLDGDEEFVKESWVTAKNDKVIRFKWLSPDISEKNNYICDRFISDYGDKPNITYFRTATGAMYFYSPDYESISNNEFKQWVSENPITVVYELATPWEEIVSTSQVYLKANTNATRRTIEINSSVPAKVIEFKSFIEEDLVLKANTRYAIRFDCRIFNSDSAPITQSTTIKLGGATINPTIKSGRNTVYITTPVSLNNNRLVIDCIKGDISNVVVSEWADTVNDCQVEYFEGLKSVCETGNNVIELKICGQNLANPAYYGNASNYIGIPNNYYYIAPLFVGVGKSVKVNVTLKTNSKGSNLWLLVVNNSRFNGYADWCPIIHAGLDYLTNISTISADKDGYIYFAFANLSQVSLDKAITYIDQLTITTDTTVTKHIPYTEETVKVQLTSPLLKGDKLVVQDEKMYHYHKMGKVVLNGSEDWEYISQPSDEFKGAFVIRRMNPALKFNQIAISDRFDTRIYNSSITDDGITIGGSNDMYLYINPQKLSTIDADGLKQWLQDNPTTVVYELAEPYYEEVHTIGSPRRNDRMILPVHKDSIATINSVIPTEKVVFKAFEEELDMLEANTRYRVRTKARKTVNNASITLGGKNVNTGNKISSSEWITTTNDITDSKLVIDGFCTGLLNNVQIVKNVIPNGLEETKFKMISVDSSVKLISRGKNLVDFSRYIDGVGTTYAVNGNSITVTASSTGNHRTSTFSLNHLKPNTRYCLSVGSISGNDGWKLLVHHTNKLNSCTSINRNSGKMYATFTTSNDISDLRLYLYITAEQVVEAGTSVTYNNIMIEECTSDTQTEPTSYVAPEKQELTIPLSDTLKSLPNGVCDRIVKLYGEWYVERNVGEVTYSNNVTNEMIHGYVYKTDMKYQKVELYLPSDSVYIDLITTDNLICDKFTTVTHNIWANIDKKCIALSGNNKIAFRTEDIPANLEANSINKDTIKQWLSENPLTVQYQLATPIYEKLTVKPTMKSWSGYTTVQVDSIAPSTVTMKNHSLNALIKPNTQYTIQLGMVNASPITVNLGGKKAVVGGYTPTVITTDATVNDQIVLTGDTSKGQYVQNVTLVEGDKSANMPSYFTKMVPNSNTTKVKALGKNLAIFDNMYYQTGYVIKPQDKSPIDYVKNGDIIEIAYRRAGGLLNSGAVCLDIWMNKDETIAISGYVKNALNVRMYYNGGFLSRLIELTNITDSNDWTDINSTFTAPISGLYTFRLWFANTDPIQVRNLQVEYGTAATEYEEPIYEVAEIVTPSSPVLEGDKVYRNLSGDIVHYHKSKMVVFDGSDDEEWSDIWNDGYPSDTTFIAKIKLPENRVVHQGYCDKFNKNSAVTDIDIEYITTGAGTANDIGIRIAKIRLETPDLVGFRQWLSENPVTLVYELAEPYEETIGTSTLALEEDSSMLTVINPTTEQSTLLVDQALPVTISFSNYKLALPSLLPSRSYLLQFYSNYPSIGRFSLGGADPVPVSIVEGKNRVILSTPNPVTAYNLVIDGDGFEIVDLVVTDVNTREFTYFNGMKSTYEGNGVIDIHSVSRNRVNWAGDAAIMESVDKNGNILFELYGRVLRVIPSNDGVRSIKTTMYDRELAKLTINPYDFNINLSNIERRNINVLTMSIKIYRDEAHILDTVSLIDIDTNMVLANLQHGILYHINFLADQNIGLSYADGECYVDIAATQIELGNDATTTVTPYSKKLDMILDSPLLNNDKLYKIANGKVAHLHMSGMIDIKDYLDNMQVVNNNIDKPVATIVIDNMQYNNNINDLIVERINTVNYADLVEGISGVCISAVDNVLYISNSNMTSLDDYKAWLSTSVKVVYPLLTPYNTELNLSNNLHIEVPNNGIIYTCNTAIAPNIAFKSLTEKLNLLPNTTYSVRFTLDQDLRPISINLGGTTKLVMGMSGDNQVQITTPETLTSGMIIFDGDGTNISKVIVSPVSELPATTRYFSGVHSSFEDNMNEDGKYELIMRTIGKNKVNPLLFGSVDGDIDCRPSVTGVTVTSVNKPVMSRVELVPNEDYVFKCQVDAEIGAIVAIAVEGTDGKPNLTNLLTRQEVEGKGTVILNFSTTNTINAVYVILAPKSVKVRPTTITVTEMQLEMGNQATEYEMYTEDVDKLYLTTPLCEGDRIYYEAGQVIHQHRMGKVTFDHMSNIDDMVSRVEWMSTNTFAVLLDAPTDARNDYSAESVVKPNWYCDNFLVHTPSELKGTNIEGISPVDQGEFVWRLVVNNDKLVTADEIGMAEYLANNPVTVVYELSQPYNEVVYDQILALTTEPGTTIHFESAVPVNSILEYSVGVKTIAGVQAEQDQTALETSYQMALMEIATGVNLSDYM